MALMNLVDLFRLKKMKSRVVMVLNDAVWAEGPGKRLSKQRGCWSIL
jgi:hypothetical protein